MPQARPRQDIEISLFPFLSILVCLIGALVLIIVILTAVQSRMGDGRSQEEIQRAVEALELKKKTTAALAEAAKLKQTSPAAASKDALDEKLKAIIELRKQLTTDADARATNQKTSVELQKELESLIIQSQEMAREKTPLATAIAKLKAEIAARNKKPDDTPPSVIVQPGGTGTSDATKLAFVECSAGGIILHKSPTEQQRITAASIGVDAGYDTFLDDIRKRGGTVLFLIRDDGNGSYHRAAGWAESKFELKTGKLPLPGKGPADLGAFFAK